MIRGRPDGAVRPFPGMEDSVLYPASTPYRARVRRALPPPPPPPVPPTSDSRAHVEQIRQQMGWGPSVALMPEEAIARRVRCPDRLCNARERHSCTMPVRRNTRRVKRPHHSARYDLAVRLGLDALSTAVDEQSTGG